MAVSPKRVLFVSLLASIVSIVMVEFVFYDVPEIFSGGARLGDLVVNVSLSYVAAYFFYIVTFVVPRMIERKHIEEHAAHLISRILFYILFIIQDATNMRISQKDIKLSALTETDFQEAMKGVFMDDELRNFRVGDDGHNTKVGDAVIRSIDGLKHTADDLFKYSPHIETKLVALVSAALRNTMNESWVNSYRSGPAYIGELTLVPERRDVSHYAKCLCQFLEIYRDIQRILLEKYKETETAKKHAENLRNLESS